MKKLALTIAIILGLSLSTFADGGLFQRGNNAKNGASGYTIFGAKTGETPSDTDIHPLLPEHGQSDNQDAPLGSGIVAFMSLGAAYLIGKRHKE